MEDSVGCCNMYYIILRLHKGNLLKANYEWFHGMLLKTKIQITT